WTQNGCDSFTPVGRLPEHGCSGERELIRSVQLTPPKQKSTTLCPDAGNPVPGQTRQATIRQCRQGVYPRGTEGMPEIRTKLPVLAAQSRRHTRTPAVNRKLRRSRRQSDTR